MHPAYPTYALRTQITAIGSVKYVGRFQLPKQWHHVTPSPAGTAHRRPAIEVRRSATDENRTIYGRRASKRLSTRPHLTSPVTRRVWLRGIEPVVVGIACHTHQR